jgi:hypothetical protein
MNESMSRFFQQSMKRLSLFQTEDAWTCTTSAGPRWCCVIR